MIEIDASSTSYQQQEQALPRTDSMSILPIRWTELDMGEKLGSGSFSQVFAVSLKKTRSKRQQKRTLAVKLPLPAGADNATLELAKEDIEHEAKMLSKLNHANIVRIRHVADDSPFFFFIMDQVVDTLADRLVAWRKTNWRTSSFSTRLRIAKNRLDHVAFGVTNALEYLHSKGIAHRDIKPDNIGFDQHNTVKLLDFGLSREVQPQVSGASFDDSFASLDTVDVGASSDSDDDNDGPESSSQQTGEGTNTSSGIAGTPVYMAPELSREDSYGVSCDTYSLGILLWELATLKQPYQMFRTPEELIANVNEACVRPSLSNKYVSGLGLTKLLGNMWANDASGRPSMALVRSELENRIADAAANQNSKSTVRQGTCHLAKLVRSKKMCRVSNFVARSTTIAVSRKHCRNALAA